MRARFSGLKKVAVALLLGLLVALVWLGAAGHVLFALSGLLGDQSLPLCNSLFHIHYFLARVLEMRDFRVRPWTVMEKITIM